MANSIKGKLLSTPVIGYVLRVASNIANLPHYNDLQKQQNAKFYEIIEASKDQLEKTQEKYSLLEERFNNLQHQKDTLQAQLNLFDKHLSSTSKQQPTEGPKNLSETLFADDHLLDLFYTNFEDRFRGSEEMISDRLEEYLPDFINAQVDFKKHPVLDIGCGRGELLQLLKKNKINAKGLDINLDMVERANKKGLTAQQGDALDFLSKSKSQSFGAITGFHIVEHIPFPILLRIFTEAHRALAQDGFIIFETPNPENIIVGSCAFYMDPSHLHPIPPELLAFALETSGFRKVEIRRIHAATDYKAGNMPEELINRIYGPRDYAVVAFK